MKRLEVILTTLTRDIQCEKFFEPGMSQSAMSSAIQCILYYTRYEKPLKNHPLDVAKKYVETYSSSNAAARDPEERAFYT